MSEDKAERLKSFVPGEAREVTARFYTHYLGDPPTFVLIDNVIFRLDDHQQRMKLFLELQDAEAEMLRTTSTEVADLAFKIRDLTEELGHIDYAAFRTRLLQGLHNHKAVIDHYFSEGTYPLPDQEAWRHSQCQLPATGVDD